jgi:hypothetical protein
VTTLKSGLGSLMSPGDQYYFYFILDIHWRTLLHQNDKYRFVSLSPNFVILTNVFIIFDKLRWLNMTMNLGLLWMTKLWIHSSTQTLWLLSGRWGWPTYICHFDEVLFFSVGSFNFITWRVWFQNTINSFCEFEKNAVKVWNLLGNAFENL